MVNGKIPLYLTVLTGLLGGAVVILVQPYSADFPRTEYAKPARQFMRAAIHGDSAELKHLSASKAAVQWALRVRRTHPDSLASWAGWSYPYPGARWADTAEVIVY